MPKHQTPDARTAMLGRQVEHPHHCDGMNGEGVFEGVGDEADRLALQLGQDERAHAKLDLPGHLSDGAVLVECGEVVETGFMEERLAVSLDQWRDVFGLGE